MATSQLCTIFGRIGRRRPGRWGKVAEPCAPNEDAFERNGPLRVLGREHHAAELALERFERPGALAFRMQHVAGAAVMGSFGSKLENLFFNGDRRQIEMLPSALTQNVPGEIVFVQPLHHRDDCSGACR